MATVLEVKWVDQSVHPDACRRIRLIGGDSGAFRWSHTLDQAVHFTEQGQFAYYVKPGQKENALKLEIGVAPDGGKYLKTRNDNGSPDTLLSLPGFPNQPLPAS